MVPRPATVPANGPKSSVDTYACRAPHWRKLQIWREPLAWARSDGLVGDS